MLFLKKLLDQDFFLLACWSLWFSDRIFAEPYIYYCSIIHLCNRLPVLALPVLLILLFNCKQIFPQSILDHRLLGHCTFFFSVYLFTSSSSSSSSQCLQSNNAVLKKKKEDWLRERTSDRDSEWVTECLNLASSYLQFI